MLAGWRERLPPIHLVYISHLNSCLQQSQLVPEGYQELHSFAAESIYQVADGPAIEVIVMIVRETDKIDMREVMY
jgi:hypothetical protein